MNREFEGKSLPEALDHMLYEAEMLFRVAEIIGLRLAAFEENTFAKSVFIESFVIHARNLEDFFRAGEAVNGRMKATHFFPDFAASQSYHPDLRRMHNEVAHLGYDRKGWGESRPWGIAAIAEGFTEPCLRFLREVWKEENLLSVGKNRERTQRLLIKLECNAVRDRKNPLHLGVMASDGTGASHDDALYFAANFIATGEVLPVSEAPGSGNREAR